MNDRPEPPLVAVYLERRAELERYFWVRLRSEEAARDLVQDMYLRVAQVTEQPIGNAAAYLYRLGTNLMLDRIKQQSRAMRRDADWRGATVADIGGEGVAEEPAADAAADARQQLERIVAAVKELPATTQAAFRLHKLEGLSHVETAAALGVSRSTVEKHIMTSLRHIQKKMGQ